MASGVLLILIGDECKKQELYHKFDKEYVFEVVFGLASDTGDVLGIVRKEGARIINPPVLTNNLADLIGDISLPYPHFSSRTVGGKPLHTWALQGKIDEITVPLKHSKIYYLGLESIETVSFEALKQGALSKINRLPRVTEGCKALGRDFRRSEVLESWNTIESVSGMFHTVARFRCRSSSGTYMRSLAEYIAKKMRTQGLAYSIRRTKIGSYLAITKKRGVWIKSFY